MSTEDQRQPYYLEQFEHVAPQFRDAVGARVKQRLGETDLPVGSAVLAELLLGTYIVQTPDGLQPGQPITLPDVSKLKGLDVKRRDIPVIASRLGSIVRAATYSYETTANDKPFVPVRETLAAEDEIDCFSLYLDQIGATPLLSAEEEVALGTAIVRGKTLEETLVSATTGIPHRPELEADIQKARLAREQFILANTRLVVSAAKHYQNRGVDLPDLVQAGNIGLMRAVDKWDPTQGNKFSTYGMHWIKRELSQVIDDTSRTIRVPAYVSEKLSLLAKHSGEITVEQGAAPDADLMAWILNTTPDGLARLQASEIPTVSYEALHENELAVSVDEEELNAGDAPTYEQSYAALTYATGGEYADPVLDEVVEVTLMPAAVEKILSSLDEHQETVVRKRFGIGPEYDATATLEEIGNAIGLTRERVRQIESKAMSKLRSSNDLDKLHDYIM